MSESEESPTIKKLKKTASIRSAEEFKKFCRLLIKERVNTLEDREKLASELGITAGGVEALIYHGRGSFETFVAAVFYLYSVDLKVLKKFLVNFKNHIRRIKPIRESDKAWFDLDRYWTEDQKGYFAFMGLASARLNLALTKIREKEKKE
jgi:hypothetical protein